MPETTLSAYWPKVIKLVKFLVRKRAVAAAQEMADGLANGPDVGAPYDQIINSTDFLEFIHMVEHGHTGDLLTAQGVWWIDPSCRSCCCSVSMFLPSGKSHSTASLEGMDVSLHPI